ncbi:alpha-2-HS-glycoprotein [Oreochromis niloticus]|uniref:alpha-2-HS-glycoprotein n=1 Tax=Oreochromis niloticus TaxID=8128 RepID=UPI0009055216|nr:alpha-2-HS-glycoprotein [Oreochromis niloticus]
MNLLSFTVVLGLLVGTWAQPIVRRPLCDSPEAEEAALVAQDYLNGQHHHGYKYVLNQINDIKVYTKPDGDEYDMEVDLLETDCHVLDPTPLANCTVRPKVQTAVEGDCDVVLKNVSGVLKVIAFKCKSEVSTEDLCLGCPTLLPLNHTDALDFVQASLTSFNNMTVDTTHVLLEVGRLSSQIVSGGPIFITEYVVVEGNCTEDPCVPLNDAMATRGICTAKGTIAQHSVDCKMFSTLIPIVDANSTAAADPLLPPAVHVHTHGLSHKHGHSHHKLTALHNPHQNILLSAESAEVVPVVPAAAFPAADPALAADYDTAGESLQSKEPPLFFRKRDVSAAIMVDAPAAQTGPVSLVPVCPGRVRFF